MNTTIYYRMPLVRKDKVYTKESTVTGIGKGLFALVDIRKGSIIAEFKGKLRKPDEDVTSPRSNIYFEDEYILECPDNDLASYANDAINFSGIRRKLIAALQSNEPLYKKYPGSKINSEIKINNNLHRAFLIATEDIEKDEEIFCHYGFQYWFKTELTKVGFLGEKEIEQNGFPEKIFEYPAFTSYIKEFYPHTIEIEIRPFKNFYDVILHFDDANHLVIAMENYAKNVRKLE